MEPRRFGIYVRISDDREGAGLGVARQEGDCRPLVAHLNGIVVEVYIDNDITAADRRKVRKDYQRMLGDLRSGYINAVAVWHNDRLIRQPVELEELIVIAEELGAEFHAVKAGLIDLSTPAGRLNARIQAAIAKHEVEHKQERILRKVEELAARGKIANGGPRPFGYERIYLGEGPRRKILRDELHPLEAPIVLDCAERALEGETLYSLVKDLNKRGILSSTGKPWSQQAMRNMLISGRIAGLRERARQVVGKAEWPAIITVEQHLELRALLTKPERNRYDNRGARVYWLSGYVRCTCNPPEPRRMGTQKASNNKRKVFTCRAKAEGGCGSRTINMRDLEELITELIMKKLEAVEVEENAEEDPRPDVELKIARWERRIAELKEAFADGDQSAREYREVTEDLKSKIAQARGELAAYNVRKRLDASAEKIRAEWEGYPIERKKSVVGRFIKMILIHPATQPYSIFNPARVEVVWR